jgi:hypothetical protein
VGVIERRLLVNYRVAPEVAARLLPPGLRAQLVDGWAVAGICLLRLGELRPPHAPRILGRRSENAARGPVSSTTARAFRAARRCWTARC